ncbi:M15 family metallopeptidase [Murinocardiopsis flavida]|uniref:M15 family metallopeptidase n=1 Tax=Murinocardiopsis flavida TaxID=645275 RepID=UPI000D0D726E|nr:M15 family metallopeptidase [Murinocardiopsis flavida]
MPQQRRRPAGRRPGARPAARCAAAALALALLAQPGAAAHTDTGDTGDPGTVRARVAEVQKELRGLHAASDRAALAYRDQRTKLAAARTDYRESAEKADRAAERRKKARRTAARHAVNAYKGSGAEGITTWAHKDGLNETMARSGYISLLAGHRDSALKTAEAADSAAESGRKRADAAYTTQRKTARSAARAKEDALDAVRKQEKSMRSILAEQTRIERAYGSPAAAAPSGGGGGGGGGDCAAGAEAASGFGNGRVPESELCALPQPGQFLRADAAAAFADLDAAYRGRFGRPMCVTDSYRPIDEQVQLFREKEQGMAARPGTSTHGLGIAVDLCGGVDGEDTAEHRWMLANAPEHGWDNPQWARGGFEPWHWEYNG